MRLEQIPVLLGVLVAILGLGMVLDAQLPDGMVRREQRRRERAERHRGGQTLVGLGILGGRGADRPGYVAVRNAFGAGGRGASSRWAAR